jgi:Ca-activated chloride channel family protein
MDLYGRPYVHAAYTQETTVREYDRLVRITPADGTFVADYPLIVLDARWVSPSARAAAQAFRGWLVPKITAENAAASGFEIRRPTGLVELEPPEPEVLAAIQDAWHEDRPPANIVLVVDTSASMATGRRLEAAQQGLLSFLDELSPEDRVALITSGNPTKPIVRLGAPESRAAVSRAVRDLLEDGDEPVYPAVSRALAEVRRLNDPTRINAVVVLSDGAGTKVGRTQLLRKIAEEPVTEGTGTRIFTVAYGNRADAEALQQLASKSDGTFFPAGPEDIKNVYREISSHF